MARAQDIFSGQTPVHSGSILILAGTTVLVPAVAGKTVYLVSSDAYVAAGDMTTYFNSSGGSELREYGPIAGSYSRVAGDAEIYICATPVGEGLNVLNAGGGIGRIQITYYQF